MTTRQILLRARRILATDELGWSKGCYFKAGNNRDFEPHTDSDWKKVRKCCAAGAVRYVTRDKHYAPGAFEILRDALPSAFISIGDFNDDPKTKKEDVLALFDRALKFEKAGV